MQPGRSVPSAAESGRSDRNWKANLVPPSRVAHSSKPGVSGASRLRKDAHDAAGEEDPTAGSARPTNGTTAQQCTSCGRPTRLAFLTRSTTGRRSTVSSDTETATG